MKSAQLPTIFSIVKYSEHELSLIVFDTTSKRDALLTVNWVTIKESQSSYRSWLITIIWETYKQN